MGDKAAYSIEKWQVATKQSLAESAKWADGAALAEAHTRRLQASWQLAAVALAEAGSDIRPLLAAPPGIIALSTAGRDLEISAASLKESKPTEAASRHYMASFFLGHAGLVKEATAARASAFACVHHGVELGIAAGDFAAPGAQWAHAGVNVSAPVRVDFGGGWSDTPPFCLDWGGIVLNMALALNGKYPIITRARRINEPLVRCISLDSGERAEYRTNEEIFAPLAPGDALALSRVAVQLSGVLTNDFSLVETLTKMGGGIEISTEVDLPMGSGLGTSSILAVTIIRALAQMLGTVITPAELFDQVMRLEQRMTTGGGWQDQAGGLFPGAKLLTTGPGLRQHIRVQPLEWTLERRAEFTGRFVLYYTGIRRIAKNLLTQVVGSYLAREVATVQVLHSIKTLANEMAYAMREGEWGYLGELLDRHWELNLIMDQNMTNAPINVLLQEVRPYLSGAKLAGAGGGGFLLLLARDADAAKELRHHLAAREGGGQIYEYEIAEGGLLVETL